MSRPMVTRAAVSRFEHTIYRYYREHGRSFPWRTTQNPYRILVSEVMLQQTQTERVVEKYNQFLKTFPSMRSLASAPFTKIMAVWHGLGYNRRALALKRCADTIVEKFQGLVPSSVESLTTLPGVGPATAAAIRAFAFNLPAVLIETNIRTVFIHYFFPRRKVVSDRELIPLIEQTLDWKNPREWYFALMDYGAMLKKQVGNVSRKSVRYRRQSRFKGSNREVRGKILKMLLGHGSLSSVELKERVHISLQRLLRNLHQLRREGLVIIKGKKLRIAP